MTVFTTKLACQENQREDRPAPVDQNKDKMISATVQPADASKKLSVSSANEGTIWSQVRLGGEMNLTSVLSFFQKAEKVSGKKSKFPVQLNIGNMVVALEKKQQSHKDKQDVKPVILSGPLSKLLWTCWAVAGY